MIRVVEPTAERCADVAVLACQPTDPAGAQDVPSRHEPETPRTPEHAPRHALWSLFPANKPKLELLQTSLKLILCRLGNGRAAAFLTQLRVDAALVHPRLRRIGRH